MSRRRLAPALAGALLLLMPAAAAAKSFGGVVADIPTGGHIHRQPMARIANLPYGGGPVMHSNRTHVVFWQPAGSGLGYDAGYQTLVTSFLANVAADSHRPTNVYGLSGQYTDAGGPAAYASTYGGAVVATDPLPANGCAEPLLSGPGWTYCLSDLQLETELEQVIGANHLPVTARDIYFLVLPNGLGTCETTGPDNCALGGSANGSFCGYHSTTPDGTILYAVIPYNAISGHCQSGNARPNANTADPALSTISHEHNETVTDPLGTAWIDGSGNENGDLCISNYGPNLGTAGGDPTTAWNEVIHGGRYFLQEEWSNEDASCQPSDESDVVFFAAPGRTTARKQTWFAGHGRDPDGRIVSYVWFFGNDGSGHGRVVAHAFRRPGTYRVVMRATDSVGNWAYYSRTIRVVKAPAKKKSHRRD